MAIEWYQYCKDCAREFGYSDFSYQVDLKRDRSRPERCPEHQKLHSDEIKSIASSHFGLKPRQGPPSILGRSNLGHVSHIKRDLRSKEIIADSSQMDIGITDHDIEEVYKALKECQVSVVVGPTGSGKSTYIPYRLIDPLPPFEKDYFTQYGPIIVTQPRIQATRGIPDAVGNLLLGSSVGPGFEIGFRHGDKTGRAHGDQHDSRNRLIFVTDGTLLNWITDGKIGDYSLIMIDEAHERSCNIDLILGLIKRELLKYPHLKLIVASATIDARKFVNYFEEITTVRLLAFEGNRNYGYDLHWWQGSSISYEEMPAKLAEKVMEIINTTTDGGVLGFLPGQKEIDNAVELIKEGLKGRQDIQVFPLYTALGVMKGREAMMKLNKIEIKGCWITPRRVVIATNVAETSITIPDVVYVVDSGFIKQTEWNSSTCRRELIPRQHSKDGCKQRWGRAGRNRHGEVYTLYKQEEFNSLSDHTLPEITHECLDDVLLTTKAAGITNLSSFSWIDSPPEKEMSRAINVIRRRELTDKDDDLTEEGIELYRLSREISRFLDKYDYNSTNRALDVASLLKLADQYACLIEAVTALAMMPRMGNSFYWVEDGLFLWNKQWDIESKDRIARIHNGLKIGCHDDLDFALKLFSLYEEKTSGLPKSHLHAWKLRNFINIRNFELIDSARQELLESFTRGKKSSLVRPIDFSLIPRIRLLMAMAWPDRTVKLIPGDPVCFRSSNDEIGIVSRLSCGPWRKREKAIVAMMDRGHAFIEGKSRDCPMANFLVELPENVLLKEPSEIASTIAVLRKEYNEVATYTRLLADQYVPIGSSVKLEVLKGIAHIVDVNRLPDIFIPTFTKAYDKEEEYRDPCELYKHKPSDEETELYLEDELDIEQESEVIIKTSQPSVDDFKERIPTFIAKWANIKYSNEAILISWSIEDGYPIALIDAIDQVTIRNKLSMKLLQGQQIEAKLVRAIYDMDLGNLVGFMAQGPKGIMIPIPHDELSINLNNPGLKSLEGKVMKVTVVSTDTPKGYPFVSLLPEAEKDLEKLLNLEEVNGQIVEISEKYIYITIRHKDVIIHCGSIPIKAVQKFIPEISLGEKLIIKIKRRMSLEASVASVPIKDKSLLSNMAIQELAKKGISIEDRHLVCKKALTYNDMLSLQNSLSELAPYIRRLYAHSHDLYITILETSKTREIFEKLYQEACNIRDKAKVTESQKTQDKIKDLQSRLKELFLSQRSKYSIQQVLDEAWLFQKIEGARAFIQRRQSEIAKLEERLLTTRKPEKIMQIREWISENKQKILEAEQSIRNDQIKLKEIRSRLN